MLEILALGSAIDQTPAAIRLRDCGVPLEVLFIDPIPRCLARLLCYGVKPLFDADEIDAAGAWLDWCAWNRWRRPDWACGAVDMLIRDRMTRMAPPTLVWGADAIRRATLPIEYVRSEVIRVLDFAVEGVAA